jgi:DnaJ-class molecular chaperone
LFEEKEVEYVRMHPCPVCHELIPSHNIAGTCPHCDGDGFKKLMATKNSKKR